MRITVDTNVLVRAVVRDDEAQAEAASKVLRQADLIAVPLSCLCEFVWVLRRTYRLPPDFVASAVRRLMGSRNVVIDRDAAEAGLDIHDLGGDFADGVIDHEGRRLGGTNFVSFDRTAVQLLERSGSAATVLA